MVCSVDVAQCNLAQNASGPGTGLWATGHGRLVDPACFFNAGKMIFNTTQRWGINA
jgi:hypothetical protein